MFALVMIAFVSGEAPLIKASPDLYRSYSSCEQSAINILNMLVDEMPPKIARKTRLVYVCADVTKDM
jgi:hypothetical protein